MSRLSNSLHGYLRIRIHGNSTERFLNACSYRGMKLWGLQASRNCYEMYISVSDFKKLKPVIRKTGTKVVIVKKFGLPFCLYRNRKRKLFFIGALLGMIFIFLMSGHIWNIDIRGNSAHTEDELLKFLETKSVYNGMKKSDVNCTQIVKDLRKKYDDVIWVSSSITGTRLIIQIKENEDEFSFDSDTEKKEVASETAKKNNEKTNPMDLVADCDCVIEKITIRKGMAQVKPGSKVKKGDILVSGQIPVMNDAGEIVSYQYQASDADIIAISSIKYEDSIDNQYIIKDFSEVFKKEYFLKVGDVRFQLGRIKNEYKHFLMEGMQKHLKLSGGLKLPIVYGMREVLPYEEKIKTYSEKEIQTLLTNRFMRTYANLEKKGVEIIENDVKIYTGSKKSVAKGHLKVRMPVGKRRPSEMKTGDMNRWE